MLLWFLTELSLLPQSFITHHRISSKYSDSWMRVLSSKWTFMCFNLCINFIGAMERPHIYKHTHPIIISLKIHSHWNYINACKLEQSQLKWLNVANWFGCKKKSTILSRNFLQSIYVTYMKLLILVFIIL